MSQYRAFVWDSNLRQMRDLNTLTVNPPQEGMSEGRGVNVGGLIVGNYAFTDPSDGSATSRPFLLLPNATLPEAVSSPAPIAGLSGSALTSSTVSLSWTDAASDENGVKIDRSTDGTTWNQIASLDANAVSFTESVTQAMRYIYRVAPFNVKGYAPYAEVEVTTPGTPLAPVNCTASARSATSVRVRWTNNSNTQTAVILEYATNSSFTGKTSVTLSGGLTEYDVTGLVKNTTYHVRVKARNAVGDSPYSNTATATTPRN
jgi:hypothetical protein